MIEKNFHICFGLTMSWFKLNINQKCSARQYALPYMVICAFCTYFTINMLIMKPL